MGTPIIITNINYRRNKVMTKEERTKSITIQTAIIAMLSALEVTAISKKVTNVNASSLVSVLNIETNGLASRYGLIDGVVYVICQPLKYPLFNLSSVTNHEGDINTLKLAKRVSVARKTLSLKLNNYKR